MRARACGGWPAMVPARAGTRCGKVPADDRDHGGRSGKGPHRQLDHGRRINAVNLGECRGTRES